MRISLFVTCLVDTLAPHVGVATVRLLERLGHEVSFPAEQTCCGQLHVDTGYPRQAVQLVRRFVRQFANAEAVVVPAGSCAGSIRRRHVAIAEAVGDDALATRARAVAEKTYELSELLVDVLGVVDVGAVYPHRVTYHPTCRWLRPNQSGDRQLRLLRAVRQLDLVELADADQCCGFGGSFAVTNPETSTAMLADAMACVLRTKAEAVVAGDVSCLFHLGGGLSRLNAGVRTVHLAEVLATTGPAARPGATPASGQRS